MVMSLQIPTVYCQLLNVRGVNDLTQTEPLVPDPSSSEVERIN
jgi:hypothetical protein